MTSSAQEASAASAAGCKQVAPQQPENQPTTPNDMHPIAPQRRPFRPHFTYLHRLVLTRSRAAECRKANHFSAHLALLVCPDTLSRPATTPKFPGGAPAGHGWAPQGAQPALCGARPAHRPAPGHPRPASPPCFGFRLCRAYQPAPGSWGLRRIISS